MSIWERLLTGRKGTTVTRSIEPSSWRLSPVGKVLLVFSSPRAYGVVSRRQGYLQSQALNSRSECYHATHATNIRSAHREPAIICCPSRRPVTPPIGFLSRVLWSNTRQGVPLVVALDLQYAQVLMIRA
jgi:hypothetical protein